MIDAYFHLDGSAADPLADLDQRLASAGVRGALVVETWAGEERPALDEIVTGVGAGQCARKVAYCYRGQPEGDLAALLDVPAVWAIRARTADLESSPAWLTRLEGSGRVLLCHAEFGIERLTRAVMAVANAHPGLWIYIPHLAWPRNEKRDVPEWPACIDTLAELPGVTVGVSALAHFSRGEFPYDDLFPAAQTVIERFGPGRLVAATDYPLIDRSRYAASYYLARTWISARWPEWNDDHALQP